jgi:hypothetical protein
VLSAVADLNILLLCLDQLALARQQLETREAECGRVAHILTDNAVELMLHHQAESIAASHGFPLSRRLSKEEERELIGPHLESKLKLSRELEVLSEAEAEFVAINHHYRNEVYHRGLRHNRVVWDLAWHYHSFACTLIQRLKAGLGIGFYPDKKLPARLLVYGATQGELTKKHREAVERIANDLSVKPVAPTERLGTVLGKTAAAEIRRLDEMLTWMVKNMPQSRKRSRVDIILENQLWAALFDPQRRAKCRRHPDAEARLAKAKAASTDPFDWMREILIPPITSDPIASWQRRARGITAEKDPVKAVKKYHSLRLVMDDLLEDTNTSAGALENHLDQLRGK